MKFKRIKGILRSFQLGIRCQSVKGDESSADLALVVDLEASCLLEEYQRLTKELTPLLDELEDKIANEFFLFKTEKVLTPEIILLKIYEYLNLEGRYRFLALRGNFEKYKFVEINSNVHPDIKVARGYVFNSLHRHYNPNLGPKENAKIYRKCSNVHGHEYLLTVIAEGKLPESGRLLEDKSFDAFVNSEILEIFHGHFLNDIIGNTSGETLLLAICQRIDKKYGEHHLKLHYALRETHRNSFYL